MLCTGIHFGWVIQALPYMTSKEPDGMGIDPLDTSLFTAIFSIGSPVGAVIAVMFGTRHTQKYLLILTSIIFMIAPIIYIFSTSLTIYVINRFGTGIAVGISFTICFGYASEIVTKEIRGKVGYYVAIVTFGGMFVPMFLFPLLTYQWANFAFAIPPIIQFILSMFALESPYLYLRKGDPVKAKQVLGQLRNGEIHEEFLEISDYVKSMENDKVGLKIFFTNVVYRKAILLSTMALVAQQMTGFTSIGTYGVDIAQPGKDIISPDLAIILYGFAGFLMVVFSSYFVDSYGRKLLFLTSGTICTFSLIVFSVYYYLQSISYEHIETLRLAPTLALVILNFGMGVGLNPLPYVVMNELMPNSVRPLGGCYLTFAGGILGFTITGSFVWLQENLGLASPFLIYTGSTVICMLLILLFLPETKGLSFLEIRNMLESKKNEKKNIIL